MTYQCRRNPSGPPECYRRWPSQFLPPTTWSSTQITLLLHSFTRQGYRSILREVAEHASEMSSIAFLSETVVVYEKKNKQGATTFEGRIGYRANGWPIHPASSPLSQFSTASTTALSFTRIPMVWRRAHQQQSILLMNSSPRNCKR